MGFEYVILYQNLEMRPRFGPRNEPMLPDLVNIQIKTLRKQTDLSFGMTIDHSGAKYPDVRALLIKALSSLMYVDVTAQALGPERRTLLSILQAAG